MLGEVDISRMQGDAAVFNAMKNKYDMHRVTARWFGWLAYRIPMGGVAVEVSIIRDAFPLCPIHAVQLGIYHTHFIIVLH